MHSAPASRSGSGRRIALLAGLTVKKPGFRIGASFRAAFSDDGIHLVTVGKRVTVWDVAERKRVASVHPFSHELEADVSPDSCWLVVKNTLGDVVVLERETLAERIRLPAKPYREGTAIRFSPCGAFLVDGSWAGDLLVRDATRGQGVFHEQVGSVRRLDCSRDRMRWLYTAEGMGLVTRLWPFEENDPFPYRLLRRGSTADGARCSRTTGRSWLARLAWRSRHGRSTRRTATGNSEVGARCRSREADTRLRGIRKLKSSRMRRAASRYC